MNELKEKYNKTIAPALQKELKIDNVNAVPKVTKIVINCSVSRSDTSKKEVQVVMAELELIAGQKPKLSRAKKSIAGFKLREGDPLGATVTLRGDRMFDFLNKLCRIVLPQVKDFRGVKINAFDGNGNYTLGLTEQIIFPEIDYGNVKRVHGLEIAIVTSATSDDHARALLKHIGMPFEKVEEK